MKIRGIILVLIAVITILAYKQNKAWNTVEEPVVLKQFNNITPELSYEQRMEEMYGERIGDFHYRVENDEAIITRYEGDKFNVVIPKKIKGFPVVIIDEYSFVIFNQGERFLKINSVVIPNTVKRINDSAFEGNNLTNIILPNSLEFIGRSAFDGNNLTNLTIPNSVKTIEESAFHWNQLTHVILPNSLEIIGDEAFKNNKFVKVVIPDSVKIIGENVFEYNKSKDNKELFSIMIHKNEVTIIGYNHNKKDVVIPEKINGLPVVAIGSSVFGNFSCSCHPVSDNDKISSVLIPETIRIIGKGAFFDNKLTNLTIPNSVKIIDVAAFARNPLKEIIIPSSIETIGKYAFDENVKIIKK